MTVAREATAASRRQRRTVRVLVASQVLGGVGVAAGITAGSLIAEDVAGSTSKAGLSQTATVLGAALLAVPLARLADAAGRRYALSAGYLVGLAGAVVTVAAAVLGQFWLLLAGAVMFGGATASGLQARYAATDSATAAHRGRALSLVVWGTTVGAVAGPNLVGPGGDLADRIGLPSLSGPYLFSVVSFGAGALVLALLLPRAAPAHHEQPTRVAAPSTSVVLRSVWQVPRARLALAAIAGAHAVMVAVMVMTPVHLGHGGASLQVVGIVISLHIAGMYAASPLMGWLTDRLGRVRAIGVGVGVLLAALAVAATSPGTTSDAHAGHGYGSEPVQVAVALTLLGLGWSCCVVAGSTLLSESLDDHVRVPAQGASDLVMGLAGALAGALAGPVLDAGGYGRLSVVSGVLLLPVVVLAAMLARNRAAVPNG